MFRNYDWSCCSCGSVREHLVQFPQGDDPPELLQLECLRCDRSEPHRRCISLPAEYHGERVLNPVVRGGNFDTAGKRALPPLPDLPAGVEPTTRNYADHFRTPEYRDAEKRRSEVKRTNRLKSLRLKKLRSGATVNMRRDRLPGDPKITA